MESNLLTKTLVYIIHKLINKTKKPVGKTQIQKLVYFIQKKDVPLGFDYVIYHFGPYSFGLNSVLDLMKVSGIINIDSKPDEYGYQITLATFAKGYQGNGDIKEYTKIIDGVINDFDGKPVSDLEILSTLQYLYDIFKKAKKTITTQDLTKGLYSLKPKYDGKNVDNLINELVQKKYIDTIPLEPLVASAF